MTSSTTIIYYFIKEGCHLHGRRSTLAYLFLCLLTWRVPKELMGWRWMVLSNLSNSISKPVRSITSSTALSLIYCSLRSLAATSVTPHSIASRRASWMKMYWDCGWTLGLSLNHSYLVYIQNKISWTLTSVWTIWFLLCLMERTKSNTFRFLSLVILLSWLNRMIKTPVLPTPALQWTTIGPELSGLETVTLRIKWRNDVGYSGAPWSGQMV